MTGWENSKADQQVTRLRGHILPASNKALGLEPVVQRLALNPAAFFIEVKRQFTNLLFVTPSFACAGEVEDRSGWKEGGRFVCSPDVVYRQGDGICGFSLHVSV